MDIDDIVGTLKSQAFEHKYAVRRLFQRWTHDIRMQDYFLHEVCRPINQEVDTILKVIVEVSNDYKREIEAL